MLVGPKKIRKIKNFYATCLHAGCQPGGGAELLGMSELADLKRERVRDSRETNCVIVMRTLLVFVFPCLRLFETVRFFQLRK